MDHSGRQQKTIDLMSRSKIDALLVTHLPNVRYLCGFTGSTGVLATCRGRWAFFTDGRYTTQAAEQVQSARVIIAKGPAIAAAAKWLERAQAKFVGIEAEHMAVSMSSALKKMLPRTSKIRETRGLVESIRTIKEPEEIASIREAVVAGAGLLDAALRVLRPGIPETAVAAEIEYADRHGVAVRVVEVEAHPAGSRRLRAGTEDARRDAVERAMGARNGRRRAAGSGVARAQAQGQEYH
jgi:Xaa-Pro aminopeptidase